MVILVAYWILTLACCFFGFVRGGVSGRWGSAIFLAGALATVPASLIDSEWQSTVYPILWIDVACLAGFICLALRSDCYWPLWFAGFHLVAVLIHLATIITPDVLPKAYAAMQTIWAIPMLLVMVRGIVLDRRAIAADDVSNDFWWWQDWKAPRPPRDS